MHCFHFQAFTKGYFYSILICKISKSPPFIVICSMPLKIIDHGSKEYEQMVALRTEILRKPLGLTYTPEVLEMEKNDILLGAFEDDQIMACCILSRYNADTCQLRQMAVHQSMQRNGVGGALMNFAENMARDKGYKFMMMHARASAVGFYEKLGYKVDSDEFEEVTLPHFEMKKVLI